MQLLDIAFVEPKLGRCARNLTVREHPDLEPARDQALDLLKLLKIRS